MSTSGTGGSAGSAGPTDLQGGSRRNCGKAKLVIVVFVHDAEKAKCPRSSISVHRTAWRREKG